MYKKIAQTLSLAGLLSAQVIAKADFKIAVADLQALVHESEYALEVKETAQKQQKHMEQLVQKLQEQLENERKKLIQNAETSNFGSLTEAKMQNDLSATRKVLEAQLEKDRVNASLEVEKASIDCRNKIKSLVAEYAKTNHLDAVLDTKSEGVLFVGDELDKTETIKSFIAEKFKTDRRKASLLASVTTDGKDNKSGATIVAAADNKVELASKNA